MRTALVFAAVVMASAARAEEPPVATAAPEAPMSVADQIDIYLKSSPVLEVEPRGGAEGVVPPGGGLHDRKVHGEISVGVGTGGYRSVYVRTDMPLGETGHLSLAFGEARHSRGWGLSPSGCGPAGWTAMDDPGAREACRGGP